MGSLRLSIGQGRVTNMPVLEDLTKSLDRMSWEELKERVRKLREGRIIKRRIKKEHTMKGKRDANRSIRKKFDKMSDEEKAALIKLLTEK